MNVRQHVLSTITDWLETYSVDLINTDPENFVGVYTDRLNKVIDSVVYTDWFEEMSYEDKAYAIVYAHLQFSKIVMEAALGGDLDDQESVVSLKEKLEKLDTTCDDQTRSRLDPLLQELNNVQADKAPIGLSRKANLLVIEGVEAFDKLMELTNESDYGEKED